MLQSCKLLVAGACVCLAAMPNAARAQSESGQQVASNQAKTIVVTGRARSLVGTANSAAEGIVGAQDIQLRPLLRPGEIVENVPGVIITQHSGSGKANQYFLRGFNLDHGTDLAVSVDGMPVNMPTHAHGQGYADLNFLIPELVESVNFRKGPYYADVGDFGAAGAFGINYYDTLPAGLVRVEGGQVGYGRALVADNAGIGPGNLIYAVEFEHNDGPWDKSDNARKYNGLLRYTQGDEDNGLTLTGMGYRNDWHSTDQVPLRAITSGLISRWGNIDPADGGGTGRYALSADWHRGDEQSSTHLLAYALYYDLNLFSDFTYFLDDPVHGDQIEQQDKRYEFGAKASQAWHGTLLGRPSDTTLGLDVRDDEIHLGLFHTEARVRLTTTTDNAVEETSGAPYIENETRWTSWFRTTLGLREDLFRFDVRNIAGGNAGDKDASQFSPKLAVAFGPWADTEVYIDGGYGFHSNDARGIVSTTDPATPLSQAKGAEVGVRSTFIPGLQSTLSLWMLDITSELVWDGDAGTNEPSGPTRRYGVEFSNYYTPTSWLTIDADYAWSHARFTDHEPDGNYVPEALVATFDGGIALHDLEGPLHKFSGGLRLRYFGPRPLTQDGSVKSKATTLVYADFGYAVNSRVSLALDVFNLLDAKASDIDYFYTSRLPGEPLAGVDDIHTHPAEPREVRVALTMKI